jgi:lysophospholipase L1-like esterase
MKHLPILFVTLFTFAMMPLVRGADNEIRVLQIGDSITQGRAGSKNGQKLPTYSWRYELWKMLVDNDLDEKVDFVGSLKGGFQGSPDWADYKGKVFDRDHEGHWGWPTHSILPELPGWLEKYDADIAIIMLGSNDTKRWKKDHPGLDEEAQQEKGFQDTLENIRGIIGALRADRPGVKVLIGLPYQEWKPFPKMREHYRELAEEMSTEDSPVITADPSRGWISKPGKKGAHTVDWVHPTPGGDRKIAEVYFEAIKPWLTD